MRIAITGHRDLDCHTTDLVEAEIRALLARFGRNIVGVSCLAAGADQIFARAVLNLGGRLEVVLPWAGYETTLAGRARRGFDELRTRASATRVLTRLGQDSHSYLAAGLRLLDDADALIAVWDGHAARGRGGTAEIAHHARQRHLPVHRVWPPTATRTTALRSQATP
ncbi:hypothetical protein [Spirillospora sp. CA-294931]|uniref:hypothetical protein n=1 Tax=Spirillospora sp. CA-294931 TaxID=3240042 RepID=UPI003D8BDA19